MLPLNTMQQFLVLPVDLCRYHIQITLKRGLRMFHDYRRCVLQLKPTGGLNWR
jgi:hypothetical protein